MCIHNYMCVHVNIIVFYMVFDAGQFKNALKVALYVLKSAVEAVNYTSDIVPTYMYTAILLACKDMSTHMYFYATRYVHIHVYVPG